MHDPILNEIIMPATEITSFADLALSDSVQKAVQAVGYEQPSPIQAASIPHLLEGGDLLGVAQTGTGKTAAFALPLLSRLDLSINSPQTLVLCPTRELAIQVAEAFKTYASKMKGFHVLPIYGGQDMSGQLRQLKRGVHVVVGTPGRVMDHLRRKSLKLDALTSLVLDEADEMLRMGFIDDVEWILQHTPEQKQTALFSATMPKPIKKVADNYLTKPKEIRIESETTTGDQIEQHYLILNGFERKLDALTRILEAETFDAILIFVRTKTNTVELAEKLEARGYSASPLNGDMNQTLRERTINRLKKGQLDIVVATDVAARGIDVERISHVVNFDIPYDSEAYVHRIGRTGRAGRKGKAILFVAQRERRLLQTIERATRQPIAVMSIPSGREVSSKRVDSFKELLTETLNNQNLDYFYDLLSDYSSEQDRSAEEIASALTYLLQRERPLQVADLPENKRRERKSHDRDGRDGRDRSRGKSDNRRDSRGSDDDGDRKSRRPRREKDESDGPLETYRIEVGRNHEVSPGDIVGAIANEAGLESRYIGHIKLHDDFSTVELPAGMPKEVMQHLSKVRVRQQPLKIKRDVAGQDDSGDKPKRKSPIKDKPRRIKPPSDKQTSEKKTTPRVKPRKKAD